MQPNLGIQPTKNSTDPNSELLWNDSSQSSHLDIMKT